MEEKKTEYDFYGMGVRHARIYMDSLNETYKSIQATFGEDAAMEFICGVVTLIPTYKNFISNDIELEKENGVYKGNKHC